MSSEKMTYAAAIKVLMGMYRVQDDAESVSPHEKENMALDIAIAAIRELMVKGEPE